MKKIKLFSIVSFCLVTALLLSSCGITNHNDFTKQKYTNFKKGKSTVSIKKVTKAKKDAEIASGVSDKIEIAQAATVSENEPPQTIVTSVPEIKNKSDNTVNQSMVVKETAKEKINHATSYLTNKFRNKASTTSNQDGGNGLSIFWVVILIILTPMGSWPFSRWVWLRWIDQHIARSCIDTFNIMVITYCISINDLIIPK